jgi:PilZ domain
MKSRAKSNTDQDTRSADSKTAFSGRKGRKYPRNKLSAPVIVESGKHVIKGHIVDLSLSGAFLLLPELPDPTQSVRLTINLTGFPPLVLSAELVRFEIRPEGDGSSHLYGLAVHFLSLSSEDRQLLFNALRI